MLADYIEGIKVDRELADKGLGWLNRLLYYNRKPSTVLERADYLYKQLQFPGWCRESGGNLKSA